MKKNTLSVRMSLLCVPALVSLLAGCVSTTPEYDKRFGDAVRQSRQQMTINPNAGSTADAALGMDGNSAREALLHYQSTFRSQPPVANVFSVGGR